MNDCFPDEDAKLELLKDKPDLDRLRGLSAEGIWSDDIVNWNQDEPCAMKNAVEELKRQGKKPPFVLHLVCHCSRCTPRF